MVTILHFADAHIDMANYGRHDPHSGLPVRVMDYLKSLDTIIDTAIAEKVDAVLFAGDAYKDRTPAPTFQREWGRRIMRLSRADIPVLLLVGNHDLAPTLGRAHALETFETLEVPHVKVLDRPEFYAPADLFGLPMQLIALPWVSRTGLMAHLNLSATNLSQVYEQIEIRLSEMVYDWLDAADPDLPIVLTAHASVQGAVYGGERTVMLGSDLVLSGSLVKHPRLDYAALGHIHKPQDLNKGLHPPVIYPGSIERLDFGEAGDNKYFVIAHIQRGNTQVEWRQLTGIRPFVDRTVRLESPENVTERMLAALPSASMLEGAILRFTVEYPREWEDMLDETALRDHTARALDFHLVKRPTMGNRARLSQDKPVGSLTPLELLDLYWQANKVDPGEAKSLSKLAQELLEDGWESG